MAIELIAELARFWSHVDKSGDCWHWTAYRNHDGYGRFWRKTGTVTASRYSYELHKGPVPTGLSVLHKCDNPACVNPAHLYAGTQSENIQEAFQKGRKTAPHGRYWGRTHCERGHELKGRNIAYFGKRPTKICRACAVERTRRWRLANAS